MMKQDRYEGRGVNIMAVVVGLMVTSLAIFSTWWFIIQWNRILTEYGPLTVITLILWDGIALLFWFQSVGRIVVEKDGIIYERVFWDFLSKIFPDVVYHFETIEKIEVNGYKVSIRCGPWYRWGGNQSLTLVRNPEGFIEAVKRYAPDKLEVVSNARAEPQIRYSQDLLAWYRKLYPHNPEGVLEVHIMRKMKEGKTREQAIEELEAEIK